MLALRPSMELRNLRTTLEVTTSEFHLPVIPSPDPEAALLSHGQTYCCIYRAVFFSMPTSPLREISEHLLHFGVTQ